jgi:hypothetical protein
LLLAGGALRLKRTTGCLHISNHGIRRSLIILAASGFSEPDVMLPAVADRNWHRIEDVFEVAIATAKNRRSRLFAADWSWV